MSHSELCWRHVVWGTHGSWLPGDVRGFRSRKHRIHSSGDYKSPPPEGEHAELHRHVAMHCPGAVVLPAALRAVAGRTLVTRLLEVEKVQLLALCVCPMHCHMLAKMPADIAQSKKMLGRVKGYASHEMGALLTGKIWGAGGGFHVIKDQKHQRQVFHYILEDQGEQAWVWDFRRGEVQSSRSL